MSLSIALQNALSGIQANEALIDIVSRNVANANSEGYTRKSTTMIAQTLGGQGRGVDVGEISRVVDERVLSDMRRALAKLGDSRVQDFYLGQIADRFGTPSNDSSLGAGLTDLAATLQALATSPEVGAYRTTAVTAAADAAHRLNSLSTQIQSLRQDADREIAAKITVINTEAKEIANVNGKIEALRAIGSPTADLEDLRDLAINKIAELIDVRYFERPSGGVVLTLSNGRVLTDQHARTLSHSPASALSADIAYPGNGIGGIMMGGTDITAVIGSGELNGLIEIRDKILPDLQATLDLLAETLRDDLNAVHNGGTAQPPVRTLTGTRVFADPANDAITLTAAVRIAVVDGAGQFVRHFDLAAGTHTISQVEAQIDTNLAGFATASTAVNGPLSITADNALNGIAIVDLGTQTVSPAKSIKTYSGFSNYFGLNDLFVTPGKVQGQGATNLATLIQVRADIVTDPARLARGKLEAQISPAPKAGDRAVALGDASIAQALADKFVEKLSFSATGNLPVTTATFAGYATEILSANAIAAGNAEKAAIFQDALAQEYSFKNQEISAVNIDEELHNMILYENAYAATGRLIQAVKELMDILIDITR